MAGGTAIGRRPYGSWAVAVPDRAPDEGRGHVRRDRRGRRPALVARGPAGGGRPPGPRPARGRRDATRLTPEGFNARSRVHEYGGGATLVTDDLVVVSDFPTGPPPPRHRPGRPRAADAGRPRVAVRRPRRWTAPRNRLLAIREDHEPDTLARHGEAENALVAIDLASGEVEVLAEGTDFLLDAAALAGRHAARVAPRGTTRTCRGTGRSSSLAVVDAAGPPGRPARRRRQRRRLDRPAALVAGGRPPLRRRAGRLDEPVPARRGRRVERVGQPIEAEFAVPGLGLRLSNYAFRGRRLDPRDRPERGPRPAVPDRPADGAATPLDLPFTEIELRRDRRRPAVFRAAAPDRAVGGPRARPRHGRRPRS